MFSHLRTALLPALLLISLLASACLAPVQPAAADPEVSPAEAAPVSELQQVEYLPAQPPPSRILNAEWATNFTRRTVEWSELLVGAPKDGIPAIDDPQMESVEAASEWLTERDPVIFLQIGDPLQNDNARAYPLSILIWHEIANDTVDGQPVAVTFCPLCNTSIVYERTFDGQTLTFGVSGLLRNSDLVMYDRQTESWWQQFTGIGIAGEYAGQMLRSLPSQVISFGDFAARFPDGQVLARPGNRSYGYNPYERYDSSSRPFLFDGEVDARLHATERVIGIELDGVTMAYPFGLLSETGVVNDEVAGAPIVVFHKQGTASALDTGNIREGRDVGSAVIFDRRLDGRVLTFTAGDDGLFVDEQSGTTWNILGEAVEGELQGKQLTRLDAFDNFWFAWAAFYPETSVYEQ